MQSTRNRRGLILIAAVALVAGLLGGSAAVAGTAFTDVGSGHPFANEIYAIRDAGITTGYNDGTYRPGDPVTRGAMAAFMGRGFGRVAFDTGSVNNPANATDTNVAEVTITPGATGSEAGGYVVVTATGTATYSTAKCQCAFSLSIFDVDGGDEVAGISNNATTSASASTFSGSTTYVFPIAAGNENTYRAIVNVAESNSGAGGSKSVGGSITAVYVPFDGNGNVSPL
jgi:hypothetical protein